LSLDAQGRPLAIVDIVTFGRMVSKLSSIIMSRTWRVSLSHPLGHRSRAFATPSSSLICGPFLLRYELRRLSEGTNALHLVCGRKVLQINWEIYVRRVDGSVIVDVHTLRRPTGSSCCSQRNMLHIPLARPISLVYLLERSLRPFIKRFRIRTCYYHSLVALEVSFMYSKTTACGTLAQGGRGCVAVDSQINTNINAPSAAVKDIISERLPRLSNVEKLLLMLASKRSTSHREYSL
jgi:hypothetical protein